MNWDQIFVAAAVLGAIAFFVVRGIRKRKTGQPSCSSGCGCTSSPENRRIPTPKTPEP
ncbi:MAG: FeoB-associated Cys-rich membrane protein [Chthoniobacterales bacterium]